MGEYNYDGFENEIYRQQVFGIFGRKYHLVFAHECKDILSLSPARIANCEDKQPADKKEDGAKHHIRITK